MNFFAYVVRALALILIMATGCTKKEDGSTEMMGDEASTIKNRVAQHNDQLGELKDRYSVYLQKLEALETDITPFKL